MSADICFKFSNKLN